jgi:hypothetical protein
MSRIIRFAFDAVLISTAVAGIRKSAGVEFKLSKVENETLRTVCVKYLGIGDYILETAAVRLPKWTGVFDKKRW